jgi:hypothetical protein
MGAVHGLHRREEKRGFTGRRGDGEEREERETFRFSLPLSFLTSLSPRLPVNLSLSDP